MWMDDLYRQALQKSEIGVIILDADLRIREWNHYIEEISAFKKKAVFNKKLDEVCPIFSKPIYIDMFHNVMLTNQPRFCSSKMHKAFLYPGNIYDDKICQNMSVMPLTEDNKRYILIQIADITYQIRSVHRLSSLLGEMTRDYLDVKEAEEHNKRLAVTDPLTGLFNRVALTETINRIMRDKKVLKEYALVFLDIDGFKDINDTYGHAMGDKLLIKVTEKIRMNVRNEDIIARFGGDEFLIIIKSKYRKTGAQTVANKMVAEMAKPIVIEGKCIRITCSIGIAMFDAACSADDTIKRADSAMYESKRRGKNTYTFYSDIAER